MLDCYVDIEMEMIASDRFEIPLLPDKSDADELEQFGSSFRLFRLFLKAQGYHSLSFLALISKCRIL
jgi:hypothetical protein